MAAIGLMMLGVALWVRGRLAVTLDLSIGLALILSGLLFIRRGRSLDAKRRVHRVPPARSRSGEVPKTWLEASASHVIKSINDELHRDGGRA